MIVCRLFPVLSPWACRGESPHVTKLGGLFSSSVDAKRAPPPLGGVREIENTIYFHRCFWGTTIKLAHPCAYVLRALTLACREHVMT